MKTAKLGLAVLVATGVGVLIAACGKSGPEAVARSFVNAMRQGNLEEAASYWDYITYARRENPDWDTFGTGQRNLIIKELAKGRARELEYWRAYFPRSSSVADVVVDVDRATATIIEGRAGEIQLIRVDDRWYVTGIR